MMEPITIRLPAPMMRRIEQIMGSRMDAPDKATVVRELLAESLEKRK